MIGNLTLVVGNAGSGISTELVTLAKGMTDRGYYCVVATATEKHSIPNALFGATAAMPLNGDAAKLFKLLREQEGTLPVWIIIDAAEKLLDPDAAYGVLNEIRRMGHHVLVGGRVDTPLIERLVEEARCEGKDHTVREVKLLCLKHGQFHGACP